MKPWPRLTVAILFLLSSSAARTAGPEQIFSASVERRTVPVAADVAIRFVLSDGRESGGTTALSLTDFSLNFPGFQMAGGPVAEPTGSIRVTGRLSRPGMFAFEATVRSGGKVYTARDHLVSYGDAGESKTPQGGYYVFLGRGDYWEPTHQLASWTLVDWKRLVDWMGTEKLDTLFVLVNGYLLAYPSEKYPALRDPLSQNARTNFLGELIDYAHTRHVKVYLTLTTDDHADGFGRAHPEVVRIDKYGGPLSSRALTLEHPLTERYITDMFEEVLGLYPRADGIVVHPTEETPDRFNRETQALYREQIGGDLTRATKAERYRWYNQRFAMLLTKLHRLAVSRNPAIDFVMFNCWWQDEYVAIYKEQVPSAVRFCVWYYGWEDQEPSKWPLQAWVNLVGPDRIIYMPTGRSFMYPAAQWKETERHIGTDRLVSTARAFGVTGAVYFAGWNLGTEEDRLRDLMIARYPTASLEPDAAKRSALIPRLYKDYLGTRADLLR